MAEYYLVAQLPSLDGIGENTPLPITQERFLELCGRHLGKKALKEIENITLAPKMDFEKSDSKLIQAWNDGERNLRLALAKARAEKLNRSFDLKNYYVPRHLETISNTALGMDNPLEAEIYLLNYRLGFLETLRPMDSFSEEFVFYYAIKLKLISRIRQFDKALGEAEYKRIYNSILKGKSEAC